MQVIYNVFPQAPRERLLPACAEHDLVRVAPPDGGLTGRITADTTFPEGDCPAQVERRVDALTGGLGIDRDEVAEIALCYVLSEPAVSTVIPGMRTVSNVQRNAAVSDGKALTDNQLAVIARHRWERNF